MEGEINNFIMVWVLAVASLCYCHTIGKFIPKGTTRLLAILPVIFLFLILPLNLTSIYLGGPSSFFLAWLATFKLLLFAYGHGPLSSYPPLSLSHFISIASLPINIQNHPTPPNLKKTLSTKNKEYPSLQRPKKCHKSLLNYGTKFLLIVTFVPIYENKDYIHTKLLLLLYSIHMYIGLEIALALVAALGLALVGVELEPQFDEPYLATSLQDFWGRRWNLMVSSILRPTIYIPIRSISNRLIGRKWAPLPAVIAVFLVSGMMHELIFYYIGRNKPTWELTCFFLIHGFCLAIEIAMKKALNGTWCLPRTVSRPLTLTFVAITGLWLFLPSLIHQCDADVKAYRETIAYTRFFKHIVVSVLRFPFSDVVFGLLDSKILKLK
ncbi:acyl-CoA--sterol O-acyltransferase 1-like [Fagus crenata]